jgi:transposase-like protein
MAQKVTVTCSHCESTGQFTIGISPGSSGSGLSATKCRQCHKTFRIEFRQGQFSE